MEEVICNYCSSTFEKYPSKISENNYCSQKCYDKWCSEVKQNTTICDNCGDEFDTPPLKEARSDSNLCSPECESEYLSGVDSPISTSKKVECSWCGDTKYEQPHRIERNDKFFCNIECRSKWRSENWSGKDCPHYTGDDHSRTCPNCGDKVRRIPSQYYGDRSFCDEECYAEYQRKPESDSYYGKNWYKIREEMTESDGGECQVCGLTREEHISEYGFDLHVHHKIPRNFFEDVNNSNFEENLITLCITHHNKLEDNMPRPHNDLIAPQI